MEAFADLDAPDALELLAAAPDPDRAARLSRAKITATLRWANRRGVEDMAAQIQSCCGRRRRVNRRRFKRRSRRS